MIDLGYGVAIYDEPQLAGGSGALPSASAAWPPDSFATIEGVSQLSTQRVWWSNISPTVAWRCRLYENPRIRHSMYLHTPMDVIMQELRLVEIDPSYAALKLSQYFDRVMRYACGITGCKHDTRYSLAAGIAQSNPLGIYVPIRPLNATGATPASNLRTTTYCIDSGEEHVISFTIPGAEHARQVLSEGVPSEDFIKIPSRKLPRPNERIQWLVEEASDKATLMKCDVLIKSDASVAHILGTYRNKKLFAAPGESNTDVWLTGHEAVLLSKYGEVTPNEVYQARVTRDHDLMEIFRDASASHAVGTIGTNLLQSLMRDPHSGEVCEHATGAWIASSIRMIALRHIFEIKRKVPQMAPVDITDNWITMAVPNEHLYALIDAAESQGFVCPWPEVMRARETSEKSLACILNSLYTNPDPEKRIEFEMQVSSLIEKSNAKTA